MRTTAFLSVFLSSVALAQTSPPASLFMSDAELRRAIQAAPEEVGGQPGLYSLRISPPSESPVLGIRRTETGRSELHATFTDVWYVLDGAATLITGGTIENGSQTTSGEVRGTGIKGGNARRVQNGDFAVIPAGTPHWLRDIERKEILYIVVKVPIQK